VRNILIEDPADLDRPAVRELLARALERSAKPYDPKTRRKLVIRSISAKQRPRRPAPAKGSR